MTLCLDSKPHPHATLIMKVLEIIMWITHKAMLNAVRIQKEKLKDITITNVRDIVISKIIIFIY